MKLNTIITLCAAAIFVAPSLTFAERSNMEGFSGKVTAVDTAAKTITVTPSQRAGGDPKTIAVTDATKIEVEGRAATISDIKVDMVAKVTLGTGPNSAAAISAKTGKRDASAGGGSR